MVDSGRSRPCAKGMGRWVKRGHGFVLLASQAFLASVISSILTQNKGGREGRPGRPGPFPRSATGRFILKGIPILERGESGSLFFYHFDI